MEDGNEYSADSWSTDGPPSSIRPRVATLPYQQGQESVAFGIRNNGCLC